MEEVKHSDEGAEIHAWIDQEDVNDVLPLVPGLSTHSQDGHHTVKSHPELPISLKRCECDDCSYNELVEACKLV